jgi:predicted kinase
MKPVYLLVGCPGSGKSWVSSQLKSKFKVVEHDHHRTGYVEAVAKAAKESPVLANTPFGVSKLMEDLSSKGIPVIPVFILEAERTISERYSKREGRPIPQGHLTRQHTYRERAQELKAFSGTSEQVLEHLKKC